MAQRKRSEDDRAPRRVVDLEDERVVATRERLFDAAERLFAEHGYDAVSVRSINAAAGVNPGAIHFHFGSKQGLVVALLESRLPALGHTWADPDATLVDDDEVDITTMARRAVEPLVELAQRDRRARLYVRLLARAYLSDWDIEWSEPSFQTDVWIGWAAKAVPHLPREEVATRWLLAIQLALLVAGRPLDGDPDAELDVDTDAVVRFIAGGLVAPMDEPRRRRRRSGA
jgi:AcrR family transcriptional regulator